jgi:5-methylcytosine-specific restriction endonuclease McrA
MPICADCKQDKPETDFTRGKKKSGTGSYCKPCANLRSADYRRRNLDKVRENARNSYRANLDRENVRHAIYREQNRETIRAKAREKMRAKRDADPEGSAAYTRAYRAANKDRAQTWDAHKAAARRAAIGNDRVSAKEWAAIKAAYGHRCAYCHEQFKRLTMDHIVPLSKGGRHIASNIAPACQPCNSSKHNKEISSWLEAKRNQAQASTQFKMQEEMPLQTQACSM